MCAINVAQEIAHVRTEDLLLMSADAWSNSSSSGRDEARRSTWRWALSH